MLSSGHDHQVIDLAIEAVVIPKPNQLTIFQWAIVLLPGDPLFQPPFIGFAHFDFDISIDIDSFTCDRPMVFRCFPRLKSGAD